MSWFEGGVSSGSPPEIGPGDVVELQVYDDEGSTQGTILVGVWKKAAVYKGGAVLSGRFLGASDLYYQWWMNDGEEAPNRLQGWYHLCNSRTVDCPETSKYKRMIHSDKYRCLGKGAPSAKKVLWLTDKIIMSGVLDKYNKFCDERGDARTEKDVSAAPAKAAVAEWAGDEGEVDSGSSESGSVSSGDKGMKAKIADLKAQLRKAEKEADRGRTSGKKKRDGKPRERTRQHRDDDKKAKKKKKRHPGTPGEESEDKEKEKKKRKRSRSRKRSKRDRSPSPKRAKKKRKGRGSSHHGSPCESDSDSNEGLFRTKKFANTGGTSRDNDRGPFGGGAPVAFSHDSSSESDSGFQKGPTVPAKGSQQRLVRYAKRHPGRLASRLLLKMQEGTARGVVGPFDQNENMTPVVALNYVLTILLPNLGQKVGARSTRELKTLGSIMDLLAAGSAAKAADVVGQRIKALERASQEGHWGAAQYLELLPPEGTLLLERDEEVYMNKEFLLEQKIRSYDRGQGRKGSESKGGGKDQKGKGKGKGRNTKDGAMWDKTAGKKDETK